MQLQLGGPIRSTTRFTDQQAWQLPFYRRRHSALSIAVLENRALHFASPGLPNALNAT